MDNFGEWIAGELSRRSWRQSDLARRSNLDSAVISNLVNGKRGPGHDTCQAIARAFDFPLETVYRAAGMLPPLKDADEKKEKVLYLVDQIPEKDYRQLIEYLNMLVRLEEEENPKPRNIS